MTATEKLKRQVDLINGRGIAGLGARETDEEKLRVELSQIDTFADTMNEISGVEISNLVIEKPPLPDFSGTFSGHSLRYELTEFIDPHVVKEAKFIRSSPSHPLFSQALTFRTNFNWFSDLLQRTILSKDKKYSQRLNKIDVLLVWNEALQVGIEETDEWIAAFNMPELTSIASVYFQSWYHPCYLARPTWSLMAHPLLGEIRPSRKGNA